MTNQDSPAVSDSDHVDGILEQWKVERPDMDASAMALMGRMYRLNHFLRQEIEICYKQWNLTTGEFDVLATLLRHGAPYQLTPTELFRSAMLSSGAMTNRLNRLEQRGLICRSEASSDRRSLPVALTEEGKALIEEAIEAHAANQLRLIQPLAEDDQVALNRIVKQWLAHYDEQTEPGSKG
ncbi:MAG: MarR family winged helix-turn-helix transcriptional regulator [Oceanobacter sp.]